MRGRISANPIMKGIGSGPEDFWLYNDQLYVDADPVADGATKEVDPEIDHELRLDYDVRNRDPYSWGDPTGSWDTYVSVYNETNASPVGGVSDGHQGESGGPVGTPNRVPVGRITAPTTFRVKLWANQEYGAGAHNPPPQSNW